MMNADLARQILELVDSGLDGLEYVYDNNQAGYYELAKPVFADVIHAAVTIERVLEQHGVDDRPVVESTNAALSALLCLRKAYEAEETTVYDDIMTSILYPHFLLWQSALLEALSAYLPVDSEDQHLLQATASSW